MSNAPEPYRFDLGTVEQPSGFNLLVQITEAEFDALHEAVMTVARLATPFDYNLVERNFLGLKDIHQFVVIILSLGRKFATPNHQQLGEAVMSSTVNWLTSVRLFLDHTETALKRRYGHTSQEFQRFDAATASAYDSKVGYRFSWRFRNYVQHCGLPLSRIQFSRPNAAVPSLAKQSVALLLDRDALLDGYSGWGPVKKDLQAMPAQFPFLPLAEEAMEGLRDVYRELFDIRLSKALAVCSILDDALARIKATGESGEPAAFRYTDDFSEITPLMIPGKAVRQLSEIADSSASRESLISFEGPARPQFDPATIRERFHRDNRGVQALAAWLAEKGGTPAFSKAINDILEEDGDIEPLITGIVNVSALLIHMTAGALGATAEGLVAGLLDIYGQYDQAADWK